MSEAITHGEMEALLRSFGFERFEVPNSHRHFSHAASGAELTLPCFPPDRVADPHHWMKVRGALDDYGVLPRDQFFDALRRLSPAA